MKIGTTAGFSFAFLRVFESLYEKENEMATRPLRHYGSLKFFLVQLLPL